MQFIHGHTYRFFSVAYPSLALNVYGTNAASTGRNVCLYNKDTDPDDPMQKWKFQEDTGVGKRLHSFVNGNYVLDRSSGITNSYANNAHLCATSQTSATDSELYFLPVSIEDNIYRIRLDSAANGLLYLTAANDNGVNPASSITTQSQLTDANKNVYWATAEPVGTTGYDKQCWTVVDLDATSDGDGDTDENNASNVKKQYLVPPYAYSGVTADFGTDCGMIAAAQDAGRKVCDKYPFTVHYGADFAGRTSMANPVVTRQIKSSGYGIIINIRDYPTDEAAEITNLGRTVLIKYPNAAYGTGTNKRDIYFLYCHLESIDSSLTVGEYVSPNAIIGVAGKSGKGADSNHLHLEAFTTQISTSPSEGGSATYCVDPINYLFNNSSTTSVTGVRMLMPDCDAPFYRDAYCDGSTCEHTEILYFYNINKINNRGNYVAATF